MNFFVPLEGVPSPAAADDLWHKARTLLAANGFPTATRRFHSLFLTRGGEPRILQVGLDDEDGGDLILLILEAADAPYYWVCTLYGVLEGVPIPVPAAEVVWAVEFEP
jgi:hypothetical protein